METLGTSVWPKRSDFNCFQFRPHYLTTLLTRPQRICSRCIARAGLFRTGLRRPAGSEQNQKGALRSSGVSRLSACSTRIHSVVGCDRKRTNRFAISDHIHEVHTDDTDEAHEHRTIEFQTYQTSQALQTLNGVCTLKENQLQKGFRWTDRSYRRLNLNLSLLSPGQTVTKVWRMLSAKEKVERNAFKFSLIVSFCFVFVFEGMSGDSTGQLS